MQIEDILKPNNKATDHVFTRATPAPTDSTTFSTGEKQKVSLFNVRANESASKCICGEVVVHRPITLQCGHKYHFKCARTHVFSIQIPPNNSSLDLNTSQLSNDDDSEYCPLCSQIKSINRNQISPDLSNTSTSSISSNTINPTYKYFTPNTSSLKPSKNSRYEDQKELNSTNIQSNQISVYPNLQINNSHPIPDETQNLHQIESISPQVIPCVPHQSSGKQHSTRIPLADITPSSKKHNNQSSKSGSNEIQFPQQQIFSYRNNSFLDGVVKQLSSSLLQQATIGAVPTWNFRQNRNIDSSSELSEINLLDSRCSHQSSLSFLQQSNNNTSSSFESNHRRFQLVQQHQLSRESLTFSSSISSSASILVSNQVALKQSWCEYSFNTSQISCGSDKENARNLVTRRARHNGVVVSFFEGTSFLNESSLLSNRQTLEVQFPFLIELAIQQEDQQETNAKQQDILLILDVNAFNDEDVTCRYDFIKEVFKALKECDRIRLSWIDFEKQIVVNSQCDFFVGIEMSEIIAKEFMRLQANKQSECKVETTFTTSFQEQIQVFISKQFTGSRANSVFQHAIFILGSEHSNLALEGKTTNEVVVVTTIMLPIQKQDQQQSIKSFKSSEIKYLSQECVKSIEKVRTICVKWIELDFKVNSHLGNLKRIQLLNEKELDAQVSKSNIQGHSVTEHDMDIEENNTFDFKVLLRNLHFKNVTRLVFESVFSITTTPPIYKNARLFNCDIKFLQWKNKDQRSQTNEILNSNGQNCGLDSMNSTIDEVNEEEIKSRFEEEIHNQSSSSGRNERRRAESQIIEGSTEGSGRQGRRILMNHNGSRQFQFSAITRLYMIIEWRHLTQEQLLSSIGIQKNKCGLAKYDRRVMKCLWEIEREQNESEKREEVKAKFSNIFEAIALRKGTYIFEEFIDFSNYYQNS